MKTYEDGLERLVQIEALERKSQINDIIDDFNGKEITLNDLDCEDIDPSLILVPLELAIDKMKKPEKYIERIYLEESNRELLIIGSVYGVTKINLEPERNPFISTALSNLDPYTIIDEPCFSIVDEQGTSHNIVYVFSEYTKDNHSHFVEWESL